jgi:hypothetical protein
MGTEIVTTDPFTWPESEHGRGARAESTARVFGPLLAALGVVTALAACGSQVGKAPESLVINEDAGSYRGVGIDDRRGAVIGVFGRAPPYRNNTPIGPLGEGAEHPATAFNCKAPPPGGPVDFLEYEEVVFFLDNGVVCGWILAQDGAASTAGVAIGDSLSDAEEAYPGLRCDEASPGEPFLGFSSSYPFCEGKLGKRRYIWFGGDPIDTIQMNSEHY